MPKGPGKYDEMATYVRAETGAVGVIVIVLDGVRGTGFSAQLPEGLDSRRVAAMLRQTASEIEASGASVPS